MGKSSADDYGTVSGSDKCFSVFDAIEATTKRTEKAELLKGIAKSKTARLLFWLSMNKDKFYITAGSVKPEIAEYVFDNTDEAVNEFLKVLHRLSSHKISGNIAKAEVNAFFASLTHRKSKVHASTYKWCLRILDKNLRMGVDSSVHAVWPGIVPVFGVAKGLALIKQKTGERDKRAEKMISYPCDLEPKKDGFNISIKCDLKDKTSVALSSDNEELPSLQPYATAIFKALLRTKIPKAFGDASVIIVDGECEAKYRIDDPRDSKWQSSWGKCSALCKAGIKKTGYDSSSITPDMVKMLADDLCFSLYEVYPESAHTELFKCERKKRRAFFTAIAENVDRIEFRFGKHASVDVKRKDAVTAISYVTCSNKKELEEQHRKFVEAGEEGSIIRMPDVGVLADSTWRGNYVKYKEYSKEDAIILGVEEGKNRNEGTAGAFVCYMIDKKMISRVTVPTDAVKAWAWKNRTRLHGFCIEVVNAKDKTGDANASRNPVLARFRDDQQPKPLSEVVSLCRKHKLPIPVGDNMGVKLFSSALARIAV